MCYTVTFSILRYLCNNLCNNLCNIGNVGKILNFLLDTEYCIYSSHKFKLLNIVMVSHKFEFQLFVSTVRLACG